MLMHATGIKQYYQDIAQDSNTSCLQLGSCKVQLTSALQLKSAAGQLTSFLRG
jgi:hypothetical protein